MTLLHNAIKLFSIISWCITVFIVALSHKHWPSRPHHQARMRLTQSCDNIHKEDCYPKLAGIRVVKFLNIWQIITFQIMCQHSLLKEHNEELSYIFYPIPWEKETGLYICAVNVMLNCVWFLASRNLNTEKFLNTIQRSTYRDNSTSAELVFCCWFQRQHQLSTFNFQHWHCFVKTYLELWKTEKSCRTRHTKHTMCSAIKSCVTLHMVSVTLYVIFFLCNSELRLHFVTEHLTYITIT